MHMQSQLKNIQLFDFSPFSFAILISPLPQTFPEFLTQNLLLVYLSSLASSGHVSS